MEFGVEIGEYRGVVRVPRRVFQCLLSQRPTPERCVEAYCLQRTWFKRLAERELGRRRLMKRLRSRAVDVSSGLNEKTQACDRALSRLASLLRALQF